LVESNPYQIERPPFLVVISGPSGVGKDSVLKRMKELGLPFRFVVTLNTRPRRPNEIDGVDYHFVSASTFVTLLERDELLEHAVVYGDYKGIPKQPVKEALASGQDVVLRIDVQGAATIKKILPEALLIFLTAANEAELIRRLAERKTETPERLKVRIEAAREELKQIDLFDYVVVNHNHHLDEAVQDVVSIIRAEHCCVQPRRVVL
jgi:guanylate kinase